MDTKRIDVLAVLGANSNQLKAHKLVASAELQDEARAAVAGLVSKQRGCRDMLREAAKQLRLCGANGHAVMCDRHADEVGAAIARIGGAA